MNCNFQFTEHINCIVGKAHSRAYIIRKRFMSRNSLFLMRAFNTYVRLLRLPFGQHTTTIWSIKLNLSNDDSLYCSRDIFL